MNTHTHTCIHALHKNGQPCRNESYQIHRELRDKVCEESGDLNRVAAVFGFHCGTERSSRNICISLPGRKRNIRGERMKVCRVENMQGESNMKKDEER